MCKSEKLFTLMKSALMGLMLLAVFSPSDGLSYNKSWDQGHTTCVVDPGTGSWGKFDKNGVFHGGYSTKECCQLLCKACPIYANTGQLQKSYNDLKVPGVGPALTILRTYNSQDWATSLLGHGWTFNFGRRLVITRSQNGDKIIGVHLETGERNYFKELPNGTMERLTGYGVQYDLLKNANNTYTIVNKDGSREELREDGKLSKKIDRNNNVLDFEYNSVGCLSKIRNASGNFVDFQLGPNGKISSVTDNLGRTISYGYDANGNLISYTDPMGNISRYIYNSNNLLTQISDARGTAVGLIGYDTNQPPRVASFDENGTLYSFVYLTTTTPVRTEKIDSQGNKWTYYFNDVGVIDKVVDPLGHETTRQYNKITSTSVDWEQDANGNRTTYTYDEQGNIKTKTDPMGNNWTYTYVAGTNWVETETNPLGVVTKYEYDANGNQTKVIRDFGGPLQNVTSYTYDGLGNQTSITDALGNKTNYTYDANGNIIKVTNQLGNNTIYAYDSRGNKVSETDANGNTTKYAFDLMDRLVSITDALGNVTSFSYDANGNKISEVAANGTKALYVYDPISNLVTMATTGVTIDGNTTNASTTQYTYDSRKNRSSITDANGNTTNYLYDINNHLTQTTNALGNHTLFTYDAVGNVLSVTDANGHITTYNYDSLNRLIQITDPLGKITQFTYDALGNLLSKMDANGQTVSFSYDRLTRQIEKTYPDGKVSTRTYDANGNKVAINDNKTDINYVYDNLNRLITITDNKLNKSISYTYDAVGNRITMKDAEGIVTSYHYDAANRPDKIIKDTDTYYYNFDNVNRPSKVILPTGGNSTYSYNVLDQLILLENYKSDGSIISSYQYELDKVGNRKRVLLSNGDIVDYAYDKANQLISEIRTGGTSYNMYIGYDNAGNRITTTENGIVTAYTYNGVNQLIKEESGSELKQYQYDNNGNLIDKTENSVTSQYHYDYDNRMIAFNSPGDTATYIYDATGKRIARTWNGITTNFVYDGLNPIAEYDVNNVLQGSYLWGIGYNNILYKNIQNQKYYYVYDGLGSVREVINASENIQNKYDYKAFGETIYESEQVVNDYKFRTLRWDKESQLYYHWARMYDPSIGRFTAKDPLGMVDGSNLYTYTLNNPINLMDFGGMTVRLCTKVLIPSWVITTFKLLYPALAIGLPNEIVHCYVETTTGGMKPQGFNPDGTHISILWGNTVTGAITDNSGGTCVPAKGDANQSNCADKCINDAFKRARSNPPPNYNLYRYNCCTWSRDILGSCNLKMPFTPNNGIGLQ